MTNRGQTTIHPEVERRGAGLDATIAEDTPTGPATWPIAVDLDGTLTPVDTLYEGIFAALKVPGGWLRMIRALPRGKAAFKHVVATIAPFDPAALPLNRDVLAYLDQERQAGRIIGLFTAADQSIANAVAAHLGGFVVVKGSDGSVNLSGSAKADSIEAAFGPLYTYVGDSKADIPIFARATASVLVGRFDRIRPHLPDGIEIERSLPVPRAGAPIWARALRLRHWSKNVLVFFAPLLAAHSLIDLWPPFVMFILLGLVASATYLVNDLLDLPADRAHPIKRSRPIAAGLLDARNAVVATGVLLTGTFATSLALLPATWTFILASYLALTLLYSFFLKRFAMIDVIVLAGLFTMRIAAGNAVQALPISPWLLTFSMLFFLCLAMTKRYAEVDWVATHSSDGANRRTRGYDALDLPLLLVSGVGSGISSVVIFIVYLVQDQYPRDIYHHPTMLWAVMPLLLVWILRIWHICVHGGLTEDPVSFALKDLFSIFLGVIVVIVVATARF